MSEDDGVAVLLVLDDERVEVLELVELVEVEDDRDEDEEVVEERLEVLLVLLLVPSVVGSLKVVTSWVKGTLTVGRSNVPVVMPLAAARTVVARSLAVPQPNCEKPPSKAFW